MGSSKKSARRKSKEGLGVNLIGGEAWGPVLGVQASEGHIVTGEGSKRGGESWGGFGPKHTKRY